MGYALAWRLQSSGASCFGRGHPFRQWLEPPSFRSGAWGKSAGPLGARFGAEAGETIADQLPIILVAASGNLWASCDGCRIWWTDVGVNIK